MEADSFSSECELILMKNLPFAKCFVLYCID